MNVQERMEAICQQIVVDGKQDIQALLAGRDLTTTMLSLGLLDPGHSGETDQMLTNLNIKEAVQYKCRTLQKGDKLTCMFIGVANRSLVLRYVAAAQQWTKKTVQAVDIPDGHIGAFVFDSCDGIRYIDFAVCVISVDALGPVEPDGGQKGSESSA